MTEMKKIKILRSRADSKLRYANVHLEELKQKEIIGGSDDVRAHLESFLYHLIGAKEAFLIELNEYYNCELNKEHLTIGNLREALKTKGMKSDELSKLYSLENDNNSWLFHAKKIRNHSTHITNVPKHFHLGGENHRVVFIINPVTGEKIEKHVTDLYSEWLTNMKKLLEDLRESAIGNTQN